MDSLDEIILSTLASACNVERSELRLDTTLADLGFDSLGAAAFASEMDSTHGLPIEPEDLAKLYLAVTPAEVIEVVRERRAKLEEAEGASTRVMVAT